MWVLAEKIEGPPFPIPFPFLHLSLSCSLPALPAPKGGPFVQGQAISSEISQVSQRNPGPWFPQGREDGTRIALIISSAIKPRRSPFASNSLNIPSKCWKRTWKCYYKARSHAKNNLSVKTQEKNASLCLYYLPGVSRQPSSPSTPCISRRMWGSQKSSICHRVVYFFFLMLVFKGHHCQWFSHMAGI